MSRALLVVDDEPFIAKSIQRLFRHEDYIVLTATCGMRALELINEHDIGVVVSDQNMPNMKGSELFKQLKMINPDIIRILLTGYANLESIIENINLSGVFKVVMKPWEDDELKACIIAAFEQYDRRLSQRSQMTELLKESGSTRQKQERFEKRLESSLRSLQLMQGLLDHVDVPLVGVSDQFEVAYINQAASRHFKLSGLCMPFHIKRIIPSFNEDQVLSGDGEFFFEELGEMVKIKSIGLGREIHGFLFSFGEASVDEKKNLAFKTLPTHSASDIVDKRL